MTGFRYLLAQLFILFLLENGILGQRARSRSRFDDSSRSSSNDDSKDQDRPDYSDDYADFNIQTSYINAGFTGSGSFACAPIKGLLMTGRSVADVAPEDVDVVATLGDSLVTGAGLWAGTNIEFRGAVFTTGGDASIDGLPTVANILMQFNHHLEGITHGMGSVDQLPHYQLNLAERDPNSTDVILQAQTLVDRLQHINSTVTSDLPLKHQWIMIFVAIGTNDVCFLCRGPDKSAIERALHILRRGLPRALVVLIGPVHVSKSAEMTYNLFMPRCPCFKRIPGHQMAQLHESWRLALSEIEQKFNARGYRGFEVIGIPSLEITSRHPDQLFIVDKPLLNRRGHAYAAKWLWNRLVGGPKYNSTMPLSEDTYYCPSLECPYFRTSQNLRSCAIITIREYENLVATTPSSGAVEEFLNPRIEHLRIHFVAYIVVISILCLASVSVFGFFFYQHGKRHLSKGRFEPL